MFKKNLFGFFIFIVISLNSFNGVAKKSGHVLCFTGMENLFIEYYFLNEIAKDNKKLKLKFVGSPLYILLYELKFRKISIKPVVNVKLGKDPLFVVGLHIFNKETKEELICYFPYCCDISVKDFQKNPHCLMCIEVISAEYWNPKANIYELIGNAGGWVQSLMLPESPHKNYVVIKSKFCKGEKRIPVKEYRKLLEKYEKEIKFSKSKNCSDCLYDYVEDMDFINSMNYDFLGVF